MEIRIFRIQIILKHFLPLPVDPLVDHPQIQHEIKHVVAGNDPAPLRDFPPAAPAQLRIIFKKIRPVINRIPHKPQLFRDHIQRRRLSAAVPAVQNRYRLKIDPAKLPFGEHLKRIIAVVACPLDAIEKINLPLFIGKCKPVQIHCLLPPPSDYRYIFMIQIFSEERNPKSARIIVLFT